jgi:hypothetical protein
MACQAVIGLLHLRFVVMFMVHADDTAKPATHMTKAGFNNRDRSGGVFRQCSRAKRGPALRAIYPGRTRIARRRIARVGGLQRAPRSELINVLQ